MSVESDLKKDGIEVIKKLDTLRVNSIARTVSNSLCETFPDFNLNQNDLFIKLSRLDMYIAKMPEGMAEANYFYKNTSIYFNDHIADEDLEEFAIHECIHYIQEIKDKRNYLLRMGLCDYTEFRIYGLGLNEAAVQLMASKVLAIPKEYVKYFNITFETTSPSYYPLECCLVSQLAYLIGEDVLFESTINSNDNFKNKFIESTSIKTFLCVQSALDSILYAEEDIIKKLVQGDRESFDYIYTCYVNNLYAYGKGFGLSDDELYDVLHDLFLSLLSNTKIFEGVRNIKSFLFTCFKNRLLNVLKIPYEYSDVEQCEHLFVVEVDLLDELIDREQAAMRVQKVKSLLNTLTDRQREAIYLRYMQKLSYDEIADMLDLTQKGARKLVARGIEHMREEATSSVILLFLVIFPPDWI